MKRKESSSSTTKRVAIRAVGVGAILCLVSLVVVAAGGLSTQAPTSGGTGIPIEPVAAQPDGSGSSGSYNISNVNYGSQPARVDEEVQVTATIRNTGDNQLSTTVGLSTQGQVVDSQEVSLFPGSSQQVSFSYTYDSPGAYTMQIGTLNESNVMTQVDKEDSSVQVVGKGESAGSSGQVGTSATTGGGVSSIPTIAENESSDSASTDGDAGSLSATNLRVASGSPPYRPGELISFQSDVSNPTSQQVNGSFTFAVNNGTVSQQTITVPADGSQSLVFTHRFAEPGKYQISVGDKTRNITIQPASTTVGPSPNVTTTPANASSEGSSSGSGGIIKSLFGSFGVILATVSVVIIGLVIALVVWYRTTTSQEAINRQ